MAADIRHGACAAEELDDRRTLEYLDITSGSVLLVCVAPAAKDLLPAGRQCVPPPLLPPRCDGRGAGSPRSGPGGGGRRVGGGGGGGGGSHGGGGIGQNHGLLPSDEDMELGPDVMLAGESDESDF